MDITESMMELSDNPDDSRLSGLDSLILQDTFDLLPLDEQAVLALDASGFRQWEISEILGISRTTVWSKKSKAVVTLKTKLLGGNDK